MKSRQIINNLFLAFLLLSFFPAGAGAVPTLTGDGIPDQYLKINFSPFFLLDLNDIYTGEAPMTYSVTSDGNVVAELFPDASGSVLKLSPVFNFSGTSKVIVTATDSGGTSDPLIFNVRVYAKFFESNPGEYKLFGNSVSMSGEYAIVGAPNTPGSGTAYVYRHSTENGWSLVQYLVPGDPTNGDNFGFSVAISGDYAIVGAYRNGEDVKKGAAYIFKNNGGVWSETKKITVDGIADDWFGYSVAILDAENANGDYYALIGVPNDDDRGDNSGSAYVFRGKDDSWTQIGKLLAADGIGGDFFGGAVAVAKDDDDYFYALIGAKTADIEAITNAGAAYIFRYNQVAWTQKAKLTSASAASSEYFGTALAMEGDVAAVGSQRTGSGEEVYVFTKPGAGWTDMDTDHADAAALSASDGTANNKFGKSLAISGDSIIVGAYDQDGTGAAYVFIKETPDGEDPPPWSDMTETVKLTASGSEAESGDRVGGSVGILYDPATSDYLALVGAYGDNAFGENAGAVYFFGSGTQGATGVLSVSAISDQSMRMSSSLTTSFTVCDPDFSPALSVSASGSNPLLMTSGSLLIEGAASPYTLDLTGKFCETLELTMIPESGISGTATITVSAGSASQSFLLTVTDGPLISDINDLTRLMNTNPITVPLTVEDPDTLPEDLIFTFDSSNTNVLPEDGIVLNHVSGNAYELVLTHSGDYAGSTTVTVSATDGVPPGDSVSFVLTVTDAPVVTTPDGLSLADQTVAEDGELSFDIRVEDDATPGSGITVAAASDNTSLVVNSGIVISPTADENIRTVTINPVGNANSDKYGPANITISVTDTNGKTSSDSFVLTVTPVADDPLISDIEAQTVNEDTLLENITFTISDPDLVITGDVTVTVDSSDDNVVQYDDEVEGIQIVGDVVNGQVTLLPDEVKSLALSIMPVLNASGETTITVTVDNGSTSATKTFDLTVVPVDDDPPVIVRLSNEPDPLNKITSTEIPEGGICNDVELVVYDPDGDAVTIDITSSNTALVQSAFPSLKISGFPAPHMVDTADGNVSVMLDIIPESYVWGTTLITVTATDDEGNSASSSFLLTVTLVNDLPTISAIPDQIITEEETYVSFDFEVGDQDGDNLTVTVVSGNEDLLPNDGANISVDGSGTETTVATTPTEKKILSLFLTPLEGEWGTAEVTVRADDGTGFKEVSFFLTVNYVDKQLTISNIQDQTTKENTPISVTFIVSSPETITDSDITLTSSNPMLVIINKDEDLKYLGNNLWRLDITPENNNIGDSTITVTVEKTIDGQVKAATELFVLTVLSVNNPPAIDIVGVANVHTDINVPLQVKFRVFDVEKSADSLSVAFNSDDQLIVDTISSDNTPEVDIVVVGFEEDTDFPGDDHYGILTVSVNPQLDGEVTIDVSVIDERNAVSTKSFNLLVYDPNVTTPPTIDIIGYSNKILVQGEPYLVKFDVSDVETPPDNLIVSYEPTGTIFDDPGLVPSIEILGFENINYDEGTAVLVLSVVSSITGDGTVKVIVKDEGNATASDTFNFLVYNPTENTPPEIDIQGLSNRTIGLNEPLIVKFDVSDMETPAENLIVSYELSGQIIDHDDYYDGVVDVSIQGFEEITSGAGGNHAVLVMSVTSSMLGDATVTVTVKDEGNAIDIDSFNFLVYNPNINNAPGIEPIDDIVIDQNTQTDPISIIVSDLDDDPLKITVTSDNETLVPSSSIRINGSTTNNPLNVASPYGTHSLVIKPATGENGTTWITVTVDDGNISVTEKFLLTVKPNIGPQLTHLDYLSAPIQDLLNNNTVTLEENQTPYAVEIGVTDQDDTSLVVSVSSGNEELVPNSTANLSIDGAGLSKTVTGADGVFPALNLVINPVPNKSGVAIITVSVNDNANPAVTAEFIINVTPVAPVIERIGLVLKKIIVDGSATITPGTTVAGTGGTSLTVNEGDVIRVNYEPPVTVEAATSLDVSNPDILKLYQPVYADGGLVSDIIIEENSQTGFIEIDLSDGDNDSLQVTVSSDSEGDPALVPNEPANIFIENGITTAVSPNTYNTRPLNLVITPSVDTTGSTWMTVTVEDGDTDPVTQEFLLVVNASGGINFLPKINDIVRSDTDISIVNGVLTIEENQPTPEIEITVSDENADALVLSVTSSDDILFPDTNIDIEGSGSSLTVPASGYEAGPVNLVISPAVGETGSATITVAVNDQKGGPDVTKVFYLTVEASDAPRIIFDAEFDPDSQVTDEDADPMQVSFNVQTFISADVGLRVSTANPMLITEAETVTSAADQSIDTTGAGPYTILGDTGDPVVEIGDTLSVSSYNSGTPFILFEGMMVDIAVDDTVIVYDMLMTITGDGLGSDGTFAATASVMYPMTLTIDPAENTNSDFYGTAGIYLTATNLDTPALETVEKINLTVNPTDDSPIVSFVFNPDDMDGEGNLHIDENTQLEVDLVIENVDKDIAGDKDLSVDITSMNLNLIPEGNIAYGPQTEFPITVSLGPEHIGTFSLVVTPGEDANSEIYNWGRVLVEVTGKSTADPTQEEFRVYVDPLGDLPTINGGLVIEAQTMNEDDVPSVDTNPLSFSVGDADWDELTLTVTANSPIFTPRQIADVVAGANVTLTAAGGTIETSIGGTVAVETGQTLIIDGGDPITVGTAAGNIDIFAGSAVAVYSHYNQNFIKISGTGVLSAPSVTPDGFTATATVVTANLGTVPLELTFDPYPNANSDQYGDAEIYIKVWETENETQFAESSFLMTVEAQPDAPIIAGIPANLSLVTTEDTRVQFSTYDPSALNPPLTPPFDTPIFFTVTDPDWEVLTITAVTATGDKELIPDENLRIYKLNDPPGLKPGYFEVAVTDDTPVGIDVDALPASHQLGVALVTIQVTDGISTVDAEFSVQVTNKNDAPILTDITLPEEAVLEESVTDIPFSVKEWDMDTLTITAASDPAAMFSIDISGQGDEATVYTQPGETKDLNLKLTGLENQYGQAQITLTITDALGESVVKVFDIMVENVNDAPMITSDYEPPISTNEEAESPSVNFLVGDVDGDKLSLSVSTSLPAVVPIANVRIAGLFTNPDQYISADTLGAVSIDAIQGEATPTIPLKMKFIPANNQWGIGTITIKVTDEGGITEEFEFIFEVNVVNDRPVIELSGGLEYETSENTPIEIPITITELDGDDVTIDIHTASPSAILPDDGDHISIAGTYQNTYSLVEPLPGEPTTLNVLLTPVQNQAGTVSLTITAQDSSGEDDDTAVRSFTLKVLVVSEGPEIIDIFSPQVIEVETPTYIYFWLLDADTPESVLRANMTINSDNQELVPNGNIGTPEYLPLESFEGQYRYRFTVESAPNAISQDAADTAGITIYVTDNDNSDESAFDVMVIPPGNAPSIINYNNEKTIYEDDTAAFIKFSVRDPDTPESQLRPTLKFISDNDELVPSAHFGLPTYLENESDPANGVYRYQVNFTPAEHAYSVDATDVATVTIEVSDSQYTDRQTFTVYIIGINDPPRFVGIPPVIEMDENTTKEISFSVVDPDIKAGGERITVNQPFSTYQILQPNIDRLIIGGLEPDGTVEIMPDGLAQLTLTVIPEPNNSGPSSFSITVTDGSGSATASETYEYSVNVGEIIDGDVNNDETIDLADAILILQVLAGIDVNVNLGADVNGDVKLGLGDVIYIMQEVANL